MKLFVPAGTSSVSHDGIDIPVVDGAIDVEGAAFDDLHDGHSFLTQGEADAIADEAGKAAAVAAAVVATLKKR